MTHCVLGIDPAATLQRTVWVLQRDGVPVASGRGDALPRIGAHMTGGRILYPPLIDGEYLHQLDAVIIESITAPPNAQGRRTIWLRPGTNGSTIIPVARTEGRLIGHLLALYPRLPVYGVPRDAIVNALRIPELIQRRGAHPKGVKLDHALARHFASLGLCTAKFYLRNTRACLQVLGSPHLTSADLRDAFAASLYSPDTDQWRI